MSDLPGLLSVIGDNTVSEVQLQPETLAVLLYALDKIADHRVWLDYRGEFMSDSDIELIHELVETAVDDIMRPIMLVPAGTTMIWHTNAPPTRWLLCTGGAVLKAEYPELYAVIGDKYGSTSTQFGLPNMQDISPFGVGGIVGLDGYVGAQNHTLTTAQLPAHNHAVTDPGHVHALALRGSLGAGSVARSGSNDGTTASFNTGSNTTGITTQNTGTGAAHNNMHPVFGVNFIIYGGKEI